MGLELRGHGWSPAVLSMSAADNDVGDVGIDVTRRMATFQKFESKEFHLSFTVVSDASPITGMGVACSRSVRRPFRSGFELAAHLPEESIGNPIHRASSSLYNLQEDAALEDLDQFFQKREMKKSSLYGKTVFWGTAIFLFGLLGSILSAAAGSTSLFSETQQYINMFLRVSLVAGVCIISVVPADEFDIEIELSKRRWLRLIFASLLGVASLIVGLLFLSQFPYVHGLIIFIVGLYFFLSHWQCVKIPITVVSIVWGLSISFTVFCHFLNSYLAPTVGDWISVISFRPGTFALQSDLSILFNAIIYFLLGIVCTFATFAYYAIFFRGGRTEGSDTLALYATLWWQVVVYSSIDFSGAYSFWLVADSTTFWVKIASGLAELAPLIFVLIATPRYCFSLLARYFESAVLKEDGAQLAALIINLEVVQKRSPSLWILRKRDENGSPFPIPEYDRFQSKNDDGAIDRKWWIRAERLAKEVPAAPGVDEVYSFRINMADDIDPRWRGRYITTATASSQHTSLIFESRGAAMDFQSWRLIDSSVSPPSAVGASIGGNHFNAWLHSTLDVAGSAHQVSPDIEQGTVTLRVNSRQVEHKTPESLLLAFSARFRAFSFNGVSGCSPDKVFGMVFTAELFKTSPLGLTSSDKDAIYRLSSKSSGADYFISHSWADKHIEGQDFGKARQKFIVLKTFLKSCRTTYGTYPSIWLDKTCVDQKNSANDIATLPIALASCKKVVVIMSKTYLRRLWCVWELFVLFAFSNKELARERIVLLPLDDSPEAMEELLEDANHFDVDNAHCFDPNDELKLRTIMLSMKGSDGGSSKRVLHSIKQALVHLITKIIDEKRKGTWASIFGSLLCTCSTPATTTRRDDGAASSNIELNAAESPSQTAVVVSAASGK